MLQPGTSRVTKAPLFPLRSIVTLIMAHEGPGLICGEFAFALGLYSALGLFLVFQQGGRSPTALILGMLFLGIALNYVPLLIYALSLWRSKHLRRESMLDLLQDNASHHRRTLQIAALQFIPLILPALAIYQELQRRAATEKCVPLDLYPEEETGVGVPCEE